jgi:hypothetical protein
VAEKSKSKSAFTDQEKEAMRERAREQREFKKLSGEQQVQLKIAEMDKFLAFLSSFLLEPGTECPPITKMTKLFAFSRQQVNSRFAIPLLVFRKMPN